jgi:DNA/RNA-binding domain of Phe-tRNA-synthetase-like protein
MLEFQEHPLLWPAAFVARFEAPLGSVGANPRVQAALCMGAVDRGADLGIDSLEAEAREMLQRDTRALLRHGGYKPSGRGKPSSEYLVRANRGGDLPNINVAVDACNAVSLHSGLPISVVDLDLLKPPLTVSTVERGSYVFNASGQEIQLDGLLCLMDAEGPRANAVKDCHATKTHAGTEAVLNIIWGPREHADHCERVLAAHMALLAEAGATVERIPGAWASS